MDATDSIAPQTEQATLSYDDTVAYEEQLPTEAERAAEAARSASLANRIGNSRVYLLSESSTAATRITKVCNVLYTPPYTLVGSTYLAKT